MIFCGVNLTHDGGVALIDNSKLIFSIEMEKLGNAPRHSKLEDLSQIFDILHLFGYQPTDVDLFVFDGWRRTSKDPKLFGQSVHVDLAPYRRGILSSHPLDEYAFRLWDVPYSSFYHYSGHFLGAYCASPFALVGEASWVLVWDGAMFPALYFADPQANCVEHIATLCPLIGNVYHEIALRLPPFNTGIQFPETLALPGKIMALIARGKSSPDLVTLFQSKLAQAIEAVVQSSRATDDCYFQEPLGHAVLARLFETLNFSGSAPEDILASWHDFIWESLYCSLARAIAVHPRESANLVFSGGCALNIKWNRRLRACGLFGSVWVPPFPNDAGAAIGAATCGWVKRCGLASLEWSVYSGVGLMLEGVAEGWTRVGCSLPEVADLLFEHGEPVVVLSGRAELGPRALGNRSILAPAVSQGMKSHLNLIKRREDYRPLAPICLEEHAEACFGMDRPDPFMAFESDVRPEWCPRIPAVVHEDGTARVQTVNRVQNPPLYDLLRRYYERSGIPVLCNTSANQHGKGFFPSDRAAMSWGGTKYVWADGNLFQRK